MVEKDTSMTSSSGYKTFRAEPGILIEVFLPKRNRFQGILYETLRDGFDSELVMKHFNDKSEEINGFLQWYAEKDSKLLDKEILKHFQTVLTGYSIYEVDGVFMGDSNIPCNNCPGIGNREKQHGKKDVEYEERTQIIKIIFMPDYKTIIHKFEAKNKRFGTKKVIEIARSVLLNYPEKNSRLHEPEFDTIEKKVKYFIPDLDTTYNEEEKELVKILVSYLLKWIDFTAIFLFGFVIYKICILIKEKENKYQIEQELWVTSHWNFLVNKVLHIDQHEKNEEINKPNNISYLDDLLQQTK